MNREFRRRQDGEEPDVGRREPVPREGPISRERSSPPEFLREVRAELKKVAWPTRHEVVNYSIVVLLTSFALTLMVWGMDWVIRQATLNFFG